MSLSLVLQEIAKPGSEAAVCDKPQNLKRHSYSRGRATSFRDEEIWIPREWVAIPGNERLQSTRNRNVDVRSRQSGDVARQHLDLVCQIHGLVTRVCVL